MRASFLTITAALASCSFAFPYYQASFTNEESVSLSEELQNKLTIDGLLRHSRKLQAIADANGGTRVFSSSGHNATLSYITESTLLDGYHVWMEPMFLNYTEKVKQEAAVVSPVKITVPVSLMTFTESTPVDGITAPLAYIPGMGCEVSDYPALGGKVVLVSRGICSFGQKAYAAGQAGASALLIYNNQDGALSGTLGQDFPAGAPTGGISKEDSAVLINLINEHQEVQLHVSIVEKREERLTHNVIAETKGGDKSNVIVIGGHSDSVAAGPGINDNGSGTAALLELAHIFRDVKPTNAVRFCWWTAEEYGLLGAKHHVDHLTEEERKNIALYLNFDMIASPNAINGIYDGDGSDSKLAGPAGSAAIEKLFQDFFHTQGEPYDFSEFDGRSDYGPFIARAENVMNEDEAKRYGRKANVAYDECYHKACDTIDNLNHDAFLLHARAIAHALATFSQSTDRVDREKREKANVSAMGKVDVDKIWPAGTTKESVSI
ncbi:glutamate carboxypeptidase II [Dichotomocladium elegans]|nr:glutamate carboxypeptidase II [Dichotomocladium elegans]